MGCEWKNCGRPVFAAKLCSTHYERRRITGSCEDGPRARGDFHIRLWAKIDKRGPDECWEWTAKDRTSGYGKIGRGGRGAKQVLAHRAVWEELYGPIPQDGSWHGRVILHTCDNRLCCNPAHLRIGTQAENVRDMDQKKRRVTVSAKGEAHYNAKLTDDDVRKIKASSESQYALARKYGVTRPMIGYIKRGKSWKHVT